MSTQIGPLDANADVSQLGPVDLYPWAERADRVDLHFALPDFAAAEGEESVQFASTETDARDSAAVRQGQNHLRGSIIGADLDGDNEVNDPTEFE